MGRGIGFKEEVDAFLEIQGKNGSPIRIYETRFYVSLWPKIKLWNKRNRVGYTASFNGLTEILCNQVLGAELQANIVEHLNCLGDEFNKYFPGINTDDAVMAMTRNPFKCMVDMMPEDIQGEFLELVHNSFAKDEFQILSISEFWAKMYLLYPTVSEQALIIIVPFSSTYLCESGFSSLFTIKTKARNKLEVEDDLRCPLSVTAPNITELAESKQKQISH